MVASLQDGPGLGLGVLMSSAAWIQVLPETHVNQQNMAEVVIAAFMASGARSCCQEFSYPAGEGMWRGGCSGPTQREKDALCPSRAQSPAAPSKAPNT